MIITSELLRTLIKYIGFVLTCIVAYPRLIDEREKMGPMLYFGYPIFALATAGIMYLLRGTGTDDASLPLSGASFMFLAVATFVFMMYIYKTNVNTTIVVTVVSFALAYAAFFIGSLFVSVIEYIVEAIVAPDMRAVYAGYVIPEVWLHVMAGLIQVAVVYLVFCIRRFKHGMSFLRNGTVGDVGVYISFSVLIFLSFIGILPEINNLHSAMSIGMIVALLSIVAIVGIWIWWRGKIMREYIEKIKNRDIDVMEQTIKDQEDKIAYLMENNDALGSIIHKDNKLIPALEMSVRDYLACAEQGMDAESLVIKGRELLRQIESISGERKGVLKNYEFSGRRLPSTGVMAIDMVLSYMRQRAANEGCMLDLTLQGDTKLFDARLMPEEDTKTLLADLVENAIIAERLCDKKNILVNLNAEGEVFSIDVYDSGVQFKTDTLSKLGRERVTTHADTGGSGIGMMTTLALCSKNNISLEIEEYDKNNVFSKRMSLCFDGLSEFRIKANDKRLKELRRAVKRDDIKLVSAAKVSCA